MRFSTRHTPHATRILLLVAVLLISAAGVSLAAQPPDADVNFYAVELPDGQPHTVGDLITLRLEVIHPADSSVEMPQVEEEWGQFEVVQQTGQDTVRNNDGTATTRKDIVVSLFEPGQYQTPPLVITHHKADNSSEELGAPVIPLKISSVLVEGDETLRDLKPPFDMSVPPIWPYVLAAVALATVAAGGMYWAGRWAYHKWWRKTSGAEAEPLPPVDLRPPEVIAYAELDRIEALALPARSQFKEHYSLVTECLREYIENRYQISALEQTTDEITASFRGLKTANQEQTRDFIDMFRRSDLVKFARYTPPAPEAGYLVNEARLLVDATTPKPPPPPAPAPPEAADDL